MCFNSKSRLRLRNTVVVFNLSIYVIFKKKLQYIKFLIVSLLFCSPGIFNQKDGDRRFLLLLEDLVI